MKKKRFNALFTNKTIGKSLFNNKKRGQPTEYSETENHDIKIKNAICIIIFLLSFLMIKILIFFLLNNNGSLYTRNKQ